MTEDDWDNLEDTIARALYEKRPHMVGAQRPWEYITDRNKSGFYETANLILKTMAEEGYEISRESHK